MRIDQLRLLALILTIGFSTSSFAQDDPLTKLVSQLQKYQHTRPYEKVYLHMDKPYYAIGDNIWFKAYVVQAEKNQPSVLSKILYAELINERDSIVQTVRLPVTVGLSWGEFSLKETLKEGNYRIRAYTNWMRNFGQEFFYDRTIAIGNAITNHVITNVNYSFSKEGPQYKLNADLNFKDVDGNLISNKDVTYEIMSGGMSISKGAGKTDERGSFRVVSTNSDLTAIKHGSINTTINLDSKRAVSHRFPIKATSADIDIQFFPEGGDLVAGLRSTVAFKATGPEGLPAIVQGSLIEGDKEIIELSSSARGGGKFVFRPVSGNSYKALLKFADGSERSFALPEIKPEGYVLSVSNTDQENLRVNVSSSVKFSDEEIILIAQSNNKVQLVSRNKLVGSRFSINIPKKRFPQGILQITLLTSKNEPIAERIVFINHNEKLKIDIGSDLPESQAKGRAKLSLSVTDKENKPVLGSFSISVVDETKVPYDENNEKTILSTLLLTSDLRGYVHQPNYFFTSVDSTKIKELDLLMLTQGWRRFVWKDIQAESQPQLAYKAEQGISISGKVTQGGKPVDKGKVMLFYLDGMPVNKDTLTDDEGRFRFNNLNFADGTKLVLQARNAKDNKGVKVILDKMPPELILKNKNLAEVEINVNSSMIAYLKNSMIQHDSLRRMASGSIMLDEVRVVEKKIDYSNSRNLNGPGRADETLAGEKLEAFCLGDLTDCLQGLVTGLIMKEGKPYLNRNVYGSLGLATHMLVLVDGAEVEPEDLGYISPLDVEFIEVLKTAITTGLYGTKGVGGVLLITMKRGGARIDKGPVYTPGLVRSDERGYHKSREFYSPNYSDPIMNTNANDLRTTIYWNPALTTNGEGKANVEFFNAGSAGNYKVIVEGIDAYGNIGRSVYKYVVK
jgi:hypothetical protein